ncbi:hypothetical protein B0H65DRAFT_179850 [Neurospora tetraspora]|uniref:Guanine deaminase n=1 Tax=Neurospora tetraspora TaxID=94610 RepID=A0AAE0JDW9_9PEZI|nr:hypothetical protein B0H65DRAFT_179850 [Neurospora tetraspora]
MGSHQVKAQAFYGAVIHSLSTPGHDLEILPSALLIVESQGVVTSFHKDVKPGEVESLVDTTATTLHRLSPSQFLIPGFIDTHNHAPQWAQRGLGQGQHILDWLSAITFPNEGRFRDPSHAQRIYSSAIDGFLRQGITTASYYGSIHPEATNILADLCLAKGQRAFVGKCNMTRNSPDYYRDASIEQSLQDTESCIAHIRKIDPEGKLLKHVLTPRFAISCDAECLAGLGQIAAKNPDLPIQTHFNEAEQEITATREFFPQFSSEADLYAHYGLLTKRSILAHCCYMTPYEFDRLKELQCGVAHCPISNMTVGGGFMAAPIREFLNRGIKVGLGTDSGGGFSSSMLDAIRQAMIASHAREVESKGRDKGLKIAEVFYLATLGGAEVCCLEGKVGNFEVGKEFDALVVDWERDGVMTMVEEEDGLGTVFEKFVMTGDDRNIVRVFVKGRVVREVGI